MTEVVNIVRWACVPPDNGNEMIQLLAKQIFKFKDLPHLWREIIPRLAHRNDGLILTPADLPHQGKKNKLLFKFKGPNDHTIDLALGQKVETNQDDNLKPLSPDGLGPPHTAFHLQTWDTQNYMNFCEIAMAPERWHAMGIDDPTRHPGIIVECQYNPDRAMWVPFTWRRDKLGKFFWLSFFANAVS
jgi:hypothetical protein